MEIKKNYNSNRNSELPTKVFNNELANWDKSNSDVSVKAIVQAYISGVLDPEVSKQKKMIAKAKTEVLADLLEDAKVKWSAASARDRENFLAQNENDFLIDFINRKGRDIKRLLESHANGRDGIMGTNGLSEELKLAVCEILSEGLTEQLYKIR